MRTDEWTTWPPDPRGSEVVRQEILNALKERYPPPPVPGPAECTASAGGPTTSSKQQQQVPPQASHGRNSNTTSLETGSTVSGTEARTNDGKGTKKEKTDASDAHYENSRHESGEPKKELKEKVTDEQWDEGLSKLTYLSTQSEETRVHWISEKAMNLRKEGNELFKKREWKLALTKYLSAVDILSEGKFEKPDEQKTYNDMLCLLYGNMSQVQLMLENYPSALAYAESVLVCDPDNMKGKYRKAKAVINLPLVKALQLWDTQEMLFQILKQVKDAKLIEAMEEVYFKAREKQTRLRPPAWMFPSQLQDFIYAPSTGATKGAEENLIIYLHGFGDSREEYLEFAKKMDLPNTASLALNGPEEVPHEWIDREGYSWFDFFDEETMEFLKDGQLESLEATEDLLEEFITILNTVCGWPLDHIFLFGYAQGGILAMDFLCSKKNIPLGGVITVEALALGERVKEEVAGIKAKKVDVPVLLLYDKKGEAIPLSLAKGTKVYLERQGVKDVRLRTLEKGGGMINGTSKEDMGVLMEWLADHLHGVGKKRDGSALEAMAKRGEIEEVKIVELDEVD